MKRTDVQQQLSLLDQEQAAVERQRAQAVAAAKAVADAADAALVAIAQSREALAAVKVEDADPEPTAAPEGEAHGDPGNGQPQAVVRSKAHFMEASLPGEPRLVYRRKPHTGERTGCKGCDKAATALALGMCPDCDLLAYFREDTERGGHYIWVFCASYRPVGRAAEWERAQSTIPLELWEPRPETLR